MSHFPGNKRQYDNNSNNNCILDSIARLKINKLASYSKSTQTKKTTSESKSISTQTPGFMYLNSQVYDNLNLTNESNLNPFFLDFSTKI